MMVPNADMYNFVVVAVLGIVGQSLALVYRLYQQVWCWDLSTLMEPETLRQRPMHDGFVLMHHLAGVLKDC